MFESVTTIWIVGERVQNHGGADERTLEDLEPSYFQSLVSGLEQAGYQWKHVLGPQEICHRAQKGETGIVLPLWAGRVSRNRRALVPSACEIWRIPYVGADAYAALVCQDKALAKGLASDAGFEVARHHILPLHRDTKIDSSLTPPFVVKPNLEGGSIGIDAQNIVETYAMADDLAQRLRDKWQQPIIVEEFVPGREVSLCFAGPSNAPLFGASEVQIKGQPRYFDTNVYGASEKKGNAFPRTNVPIWDETLSRYFHNCCELFQSLGKVDFLRIDGKYHDGSFHVIELTPDAHLGESAGFAVALTKPAGGYPNLINRLLTLARPS